MEPKRKHMMSLYMMIKELFQKDIEEILIRDKYNENEVNKEEGKSDSEGDTF